MGHRTERIFILTVVLLVGLVLMLTLNTGGPSAGGTGQNALTLWGMTVALCLIAATGSLWVTQGARARMEVGDALPPTRLWFLPVPLDAVLPGLTVLGFVMFVQLFEGGAAQIVVLVLAGVTFGWLFWAEAHAQHTSDLYFSLDQTVLNIAAHMCAFLLQHHIRAEIALSLLVHGNGDRDVLVDLRTAVTRRGVAYGAKAAGPRAPVDNSTVVSGSCAARRRAYLGSELLGRPDDVSGWRVPAGYFLRHLRCSFTLRGSLANTADDA